MTKKETKTTTRIGKKPKRSTGKTQIGKKSKVKQSLGRTRKNRKNRKNTTKGTVKKMSVKSNTKFSSGRVVKKNGRSKQSVQKQKRADEENVANNQMSTVSLAYLLSGIYEAVMALPVLGWLMGVHSFGFFWAMGIIINVGAVVVAVKAKKATYGNIVGIVANIFGIVPILGWFLHLVATTLIFVIFFKEEGR